jgi:hypothetical protein
MGSHSSDELGAWNAGTLSDYRVFSFAFWEHSGGEAGLEQVAGEDLSHFPEVGGNACEREAAPIGGVPVRLGIPDAVIRGPPGRIPHAMSVLVLTTPRFGHERVGAGTLYQFRTIDRTPHEAGTGFLGQSRQLSGDEIRVTASDAEEELNGGGG